MPTSKPNKNSLKLNLTTKMLLLHTKMLKMQATLHGTMSKLLKLLLMLPMINFLMPTKLLPMPEITLTSQLKPMMMLLLNSTLLMLLFQLPNMLLKMQMMPLLPLELNMLKLELTSELLTSTSSKLSTTSSLPKLPKLLQIKLFLLLMPKVLTLLTFWKENQPTFSRDAMSKFTLKSPEPLPYQL